MHECLSQHTAYLISSGKALQVFRGFSLFFIGENRVQEKNMSLEEEEKQNVLELN